MIVQITGTYGSGKSTVVRTLFLLFSEREDVHVVGRRMALGHVLGGRVFLVGEYFDGSADRVWTGADTIKDLDLVFCTAREQHVLGRHVVMEGIYLMSMRRIPQLHQDTNRGVHILQLTTSLDEAVAGINTRRAAQGNERPVNPKNVTAHYGTSQSYCSKMKFLDVSVEKVTRETAPARLRELLGV